MILERSITFESSRAKHSHLTKAVQRLKISLFAARATSKVVLSKSEVRSRAFWTERIAIWHSQFERLGFGDKDIVDDLSRDLAWTGRLKSDEQKVEAEVVIDG